MKIAISGIITAFRLVEIKGVKVGQFDLMQHGDHRYPSRVQSINVIAEDFTRKVMGALEKGSHPYIAIFCYLDTSGREVQYELLDILHLDHHVGG